MVFSRSLRPQSVLRAASTSSKSFLPRSQQRGLIAVPQLNHGTVYDKEGVPEFLSPGAFEMAWRQYQGLMVNKLNKLVADTPDQDSRPSDLLVKYARSTRHAALFNYASMAHNNHFFFNCLSPEETTISPAFVGEIKESLCSSVESLKADMLATAEAMFGNGFVWLVVDHNSGFMRILSTYNAGSPYPAAHHRTQAIDTATTDPDVSMYNASTTKQKVGSFGMYSGSRTPKGLGGMELTPILCVNVWQHMYLRDYGVGGKEAYLQRWWNRINWDVVEQNFRRSKRPEQILRGV